MLRRGCRALVYSRACSTSTNTISPTVKSCRSLSPTSRFISSMNSTSRGPLMTFSTSKLTVSPGDRAPSVRGWVFEIRLMTSIRKPSTPRSTQRRIIAYTAARTSGFSQLRSGCLRLNRCR